MGPFCARAAPRVARASGARGSQPSYGRAGASASPARAIPPSSGDALRGPRAPRLASRRPLPVRAGASGRPRPEWEAGTPAPPPRRPRRAGDGSPAPRPCRRARPPSDAFRAVGHAPAAERGKGQHLEILLDAEPASPATPQGFGHPRSVSQQDTDITLRLDLRLEAMSYGMECVTRRLMHSVRWGMRDVLSSRAARNGRGGWAFLGRIVVPSGSASQDLPRTSARRGGDGEHRSRTMPSSAHRPEASNPSPNGRNASGAVRAPRRGSAVGEVARLG